MSKNSVEMGWGAPPISEQHPIIEKVDADHLTRDNQDLSRLVVRGIITPSEASKARQRYVKKVVDSIKSAMEDV